ncbi:hypothetical protein GBA52_025370 [Prunus armeniaca]|nr:hypothetical protein GBA52_025370 [Prunus armeniaca]
MNYVSCDRLPYKPTSKQPGGNSDGLKGGDIDPRLLFHYGIPSGCNMLAYDPIQKILAVSSK